MLFFRLFPYLLQLCPVFLLQFLLDGLAPGLKFFFFLLQQ
jgi:hypothetical protein